MPGICGIITRRPPEAVRPQFERMAAALRHDPARPPGTWTDEGAGAYVAWTALPGSFSDCLPAWNETRDCVLFFGGSHHADKDEVVALKNRRHAIRAPDAGYLVHLYEEKGAAFAADLNGAFHGLVCDRRSGHAHFFTDRFGLRPLFCHDAGDAMYFSAELAPLLAALPELRRVDPDSVATLLATGFAARGRTALRDIGVLPPASAWQIDASGAVHRGTYFEPVLWENAPYLGEDYFRERLEELLVRLFPRYLRAEQAIAFRLASDLGTRLLVALAEFPHGKLPCHVVDDGALPAADLAAARRLATDAGQPLATLPVPAEYARDFSGLAESAVAVSGEAGDGARALACYLAGATRRTAPVALNSFFGAQVFSGGSADPADAGVAKALAGAIDRSFWRPEPAGDPRLPGHPLSRTLFGSMPGRYRGILCAFESEVSLRSPFLDNELVEFVYRVPPASGYVFHAARRIAAARPAEKSAAATPATHQAPARRLAHIIGRPGRRLAAIFGASGAHIGPESAHAFPELSCRSTLMAGTSFPAAYRDMIASQVRAVLLDPRSLGRAHVSKSGLERLVTDFAAGRPVPARAVLRLLNLELFLRRFVDS